MDIDRHVDSAMGLKNNRKCPIQTMGDKEFLKVYVHRYIAKVQRVVSVTFDREEAQEA
jgi:hypothetical protein